MKNDTTTGYLRQTAPFLWAGLHVLLLSTLLFHGNTVHAQGNAVNFDGADDYVALSNSISVANASFTFEMWFKTTSTNSNGRMITVGSSTGNSYEMAHISLQREAIYDYEEFPPQITGYNEGIQFGFYGDDKIYAFTQDNKWHHVAFSYDHTINEAKLYFDGSHVDTKSTGGDVVGTGLARLGSRIWGGTGDFYNGQLDEVRIWNTVRSASDISNNFRSQLMGTESGLVAYYSANQTSGNLVDHSSNGYNGTLNGNTSYVTSNAGIIPSLGNMMDFDGNEDFVQTSTTSALANSSFTIEFWARRDISGSEYWMFGHGTGANNQGLHIGFRATNVISFAFWNNDLETSSGIGTGWHHWAFTYDAVSNTQRIYQDGSEVASRVSSADFSGSGAIIIGKRFDASSDYDGAIDEVRIWTAVRTESEIRDYMNSSLTGTESGLFLYYDFNGSTGNNVLDRSTNGWHGTRNGNASFTTSAAPWGNNAYIANTTHFRTMSSPVTTSYADVLAEVWTQGATGADATIGSANVWTWNNAASGDGAGNWSAISNFNNNVTAGSGFLYYHFNKDSGPEGATNTTATRISVSGTENSNPSITVNSNASGWTLLGNPFSKTIHWDAFSTKTNLQADAQFYNGNTGAWVTTATTPTIAPFQGFFVQTNTGSPALSIGTGAQRGGSGFRGKENGRFELALTVKSGTFEDEAMVRFSSEGSEGHDWLDAKKLNPLSARYLAMPVLEGARLLAINSLPVPTEKIEIPLGFTFTASGKVTLGLRLNTLPVGWTVDLRDEVSGSSIPVNEDFAYSFDHVFAGKLRDVAEIISSPIEMKGVAEARFVLVVTPPVSTSNEAENGVKSFALEQNFPNPFNPMTTINFSTPAAGKVTLTVINMLGQTVATVTNGILPAGKHAVNFDASTLASGVYLYRLQAGNAVQMKKMTLLK